MGFDDRVPATELDSLVGRMIRLETPELYKVLSHRSPLNFVAAMKLAAAKTDQRPNEASLFDELKGIAKAICDFAYENKKHAGLFFDVLAKDGGVFRVNFSIIRHDAFQRPPLLVLEPKAKDHHLDSCHNCDSKQETIAYGTRPDGSYRSPETGPTSLRPSTRRSFARGSRRRLLGPR